MDQNWRNYGLSVNQAWIKQKPSRNQARIKHGPAIFTVWLNLESVIDNYKSNVDKLSNLLFEVVYKTITLLNFLS